MPITIFNEKLYRSGEVAEILGMPRDKLLSLKRNIGAPKVEKFAGKSMYTKDDISAFCGWMRANGIHFSQPDLTSI